jgi:hypothetical protein
VLITAVAVGVIAVVLPAPPAYLLMPFASVFFVVLGWAPLRIRGFSVVLHEHGLVLQRGGDRRPVPFDDVDEVWLVTDTVQGRAGASLRAMRLVTYSAEVHRLPLGVIGAPTIAGAVLRACSQPLAADAREAFQHGETLVFGDVRIDRTGISVGRARRSWSELRLGVVARGRVFLYGRLPVLSWRTIRFDRVPHPTVFIGLLGGVLPKLRIDDALIVPFASATEQVAAEAAHGGRDLALRNMFVGGAFFLVGALVTWATYEAHAASYVVAYGPMLFGAFRFVQGLRAYLSAKR